tara:strand:- start:1350 stop:1610 length:261 start_codon:yes stop_codon:yes gene_type:complete
MTPGVFRRQIDVWNAMPPQISDEKQRAEASRFRQIAVAANTLRAAGYTVLRSSSHVWRITVPGGGEPMVCMSDTVLELAAAEDRKQ